MPEDCKGGWPSKPLRDLAQVVSGGTPSRYVGEFWKDGTIPWVTPTDLTNTPGRVLFDTREKITRRGLASCSATLLPAGTLLMTSRATLGEIRIAEREVCTNQGFKSLVPLPGTHGPFLYYQMLQNQDRYRALGIGSTFLEVNKRDTERFEVLVPPDYGKQQRIAEILSTVDEAIEQTEALVAKTQQIKAGLMQDLFTRGVTPNGHLRPPREEAPQLYKESPVGWIPKEWEMLPLRQCLLDNPTNGIYKPADQIGRGTLLIGQTSFTEQRSVDFAAARRAVVSTDELRRYSLAEGNILLSRVFATLDGVGQPTLVPALPEPAVYESNMMRLRIDQSSIHPRLLFESLRGHRVRRLIFAGANASNQSSINQQVLNSLPVLVPSSDEQVRMLAVINAHDDRAASERDGLRKLRGIKTALMQDLLSGRVPVAVETVPETKEVAANV